MANKPFAIQGSTLTIGGVDLQAGSNGVVIPGVTQAVDYFVEEVNEYGSDNAQDFGSNAGAITIIDNAEYVYQSGGAQPSQEYVPAEYSVDELDDGNIEEVQIEVAGTFAAADKTRAETSNMWATLTPTPFVSFNADNWGQIPFRPKMRAGAVENVGGGGNANTGNFTFKADRITNDNDNDASIVVGGGSPIENVVVDVVDEWGPPGGPGGVWRMFFLDADYLNLGTTVEVGDTVTTSWGTPITAAITDIVQDIGVGTWALHFDQDITAEFNFGDTVTFNRGLEVLLIPTSKTWTFNTNGDLTLPVGGDILDSNGDSVLGGGAGGVVERSISFPNGESGDNRGTIALTPDGTTYICTEDWIDTATALQGTFTATTDELYNVGQSGGSFNSAVLSIADEPEIYNILRYGSWTEGQLTINAGSTWGGAQNVVNTGYNDQAGTMSLLWIYRVEDPQEIPQGTSVTVVYTGSGTQPPIWKQLINLSQGGEGDGEISWRSDGDLTIETLRPAGYTGDCDLNLYAADDVFITANGDDVGISAFNVVNINTDDGNHTWTFNQNGDLTLPNGGDILDSNGVSVLSGLDANIWVQTFVSNTPTEDFPQIATSVEYDNNGNVIALFSHFQPNGAQPDSRYYSVGKYSATGTKLWTAKFADDLETDGWGLAVDNADSWIYVAGQTGGDVYTYDVSTLTKIDSGNGSVAWSKIYDFGFASSSAVVDVDSDGNPVMVGWANNGTDSYLTVTKINKLNGNVTWTRKLDGQTNEQAYGMAVGPDGEIVAVGTVDNLNYPEPYRTIVTLTATPASDPDWTTDILGATQGGLTYDVTFAGGVPTFSNIVDTDGNRYEGDLLVTFNASQLGPTGSTNMEVRVGTTTGEDMSDRMVVVKYAANGTIAWQKAIQFDEDYDCSGADADIDSNGNIYICGQFDIDGGGGPTNTGIALVKFDSTGVKQWSRRVTGDCVSTATSIVVGPDDKLYISGVNGNEIAETFTWVVAKYSLDGLVEWQRFIENTDSWSFAGMLFGPESGGSNIAVRQGYVALAGGFGSFYQQAYAAVLQISDTGNVFAVGPWSVTVANLSGTLNGTASDIGVVNADLTDSDNALTVEPDSVTIQTEVGNFLVGTVYTAPGGDNSLVNGVYSVVLGDTGTVTLPAGGTITEGYVTSNPTIQLTPASPDVASQKLVIKGGGAYNYTDNGININYYNNTALVGDTLTFYVYSETYSNQTLYWWIYPEGAGIATPESGTVVLDGTGGTISFELDSDDYEFTVRVSPEANNYDPASLGVQSGLINPDAPTFNSEHHLHLTTGNLAETSIFLGTDNHNVRTTTDGGIEITTETTTVNPPDTITITGADVAGVNLVYTRDPSEQTPTWKSPVVNPATDPFIEFDVQWRILAPEIDPLLPIYVNAGTLGKPFTQWSLNPPYGSTAPTGVYTYLTLDVHTWQFGIDGTVTFPTLTVPLEDNANPIGTGQVLKFSDSTQQAIIFGPVSTATNTNAERVIIQGAPGYVGTTGEGGDVYVWAGPGGSTNGQGGDIKVRAGQGIGSGNGGYLNFQAGDSATGNGGWINIESGSSNTQGQGGDITIDARRGGEIILRTDNGTTNLNWTFGADGNLTLPKASKVSEVTPATGAAAHVIVIQNASSILNTSFASLPPAPISNYVVPGTDIVVNVTWSTNGEDYHAPAFVVVDGGSGHTGGGESGGGDVLTVPYADMGISGGGNWTWYVVDIASDVVLTAGLESWRFAGDGSLTFPDATVQSTAYTGTAATATASSTAASIGYIGMPQNSKSANYELVIGDMGKHIYVTATSTVTVPSYTSVDFPIGTTIAVVAGTGATVSIAITTDTMNLAGPGTTGTRTLAPFGMATLVKVAQSTWFISGVGLT